MSAIKRKYKPRGQMHEGKGVEEWAAKLGITGATLWKRMRDNKIDLAAAVKMGGKMRRPPIHIHDGKTVAEWAKELGVVPMTLYGRMHTHGLTLGEVVKMGGRKRGGAAASYYEAFGKKRHLREWAGAVGVRPRTLYQRVWKLIKRRKCSRTTAMETALKYYRKREEGGK